jgi:hypothetical protein
MILERKITLLSMNKKLGLLFIYIYIYIYIYENTFYKDGL